MAFGKSRCRILKQIRQQIAEQNNISFVTSECTYKGDCLGTCPSCEAEVRYLETQLELRRAAGRAIVLVGISASLLTGSMAHARSQSITSCDSILNNKEAIAEEKDTLDVYGMAEEQLPEFPGGAQALLDFISRNLVYPDTEACVQGRVVVMVVIEKDGSVTHAKVVRSIHPAFDAEALRVVNMLPKFIPATKHGIKVSTKYYIPVKFVLY